MISLSLSQRYAILRFIAENL